MAMNLANGQRAQRKYLVTIAGWKDGNSDKYQLLGARTEDSSIEFNPEVNTTTDILGITYTDVEKTEPQQTFDPMYILGGSPLAEYLVDAALANEIDKYNGVFDIYVITAFTAASTSGPYPCKKHEGCTILPNSMGGDSYINLPIEVHYSNKITSGTVTGLTDENFEFTPS